MLTLVMWAIYGFVDKSYKTTREKLYCRVYRWFIWDIKDFWKFGIYCWHHMLLLLSKRFIVLWQKIVQKLLIVYLFCTKNSTIDSRKTSITQERLVVESCLTPCWITFLNTLSIGVQYMLFFQWTNFGLKCLIWWW